MDEKFLRAWFSQRVRHKCLGVELLPYSLSHHLQLEALESPLTKSDKSVTVPDLILAVRVCSRRAFPVEPTRTVFRFRDQVNRRILEISKITRIKETSAFVSYLDDNAAMPEFWDDSADELDRPGLSRPLSGPYVLAQAVAVMQAFPQLSEERVWTMPMGLLSWYHGQALELKGYKRFWNDSEESDIEAGLLAAEAAITPEMREKAERIKQANAGRVKERATPEMTLWRPGMEVKIPAGRILPRRSEVPMPMKRAKKKK